MSAVLRGADLTSQGDWVLSVNASHLVTGAGSNFPAQFESLAGVTTLTITNAPGNWSLKARCVGGHGHGGVAIHVKRTSAGTGSGTINGGTAYVELGANDAELFTGSEARSGISLQFRLTGLSPDVPPAAYFSSIVFTVQ